MALQSSLKYLNLVKKLTLVVDIVIFSLTIKDIENVVHVVKLCSSIRRARKCEVIFSLFLYSLTNTVICNSVKYINIMCLKFRTIIMNEILT